MTERELTRGFIVIFILMSFFAKAQNSNIFSLPFNGEEVMASQEVNSNFMGIYLSEKYQISLSQNIGQSYIAEHNGQKVEIIWGVLLEKDQTVTTEVSEFVNGKSIVYEALVIIVYNTVSNESEEWLLYELDGKKYFGEGRKQDAIASKN